jgi:hypothetical protein
MLLPKTGHKGAIHNVSKLNLCDKITLYSIYEYLLNYVLLLKQYLFMILPIGVFVKTRSCRESVNKALYAKADFLINVVTGPPLPEALCHVK